MNILDESKQFDMVSYLLYCKQEIDDNDEVKIDSCLETLHNSYKTKTIAKYEFEGTDSIEIKVDLEQKLHRGTEIVLTTDLEGQNVLKRFNQVEIQKIKDNSKDEYIELKTSKFYVHYPHQPS